MMSESNPLKNTPGQREFIADSDVLVDLLRQTLSNGNTFRFTATGRSMEPFIHSGDTVSIAPLEPSKIRIGDVLAFTHPLDGRLLAHRLIRIKGDDYLMKGDASHDQPDGWVRPDALLGRLIHVERGNLKVLIGLGVEKALIALLSRENYLVPLLNGLRSVKYFFVKTLSSK